MIATAIEPVRISVSQEGMLKQGAAIFSSTKDALSELIQNAYRAGATQITFRLDGRTLEITDDGPGAESPAALLQMAKSGWEPSVATDPAGIGLFAILYLSDHIEITSHTTEGSWRVAFPREAIFDGRDLLPEPADNPHGTTGLCIRATLRNDTKLPSFTDTSWRHLYPVRVIVDDSYTRTELISPEMPAANLIETPVGPIGFGRYTARMYSGEAVWEHRITQLPSTKAITKHLPATPAGSLVAYVVQNYTLVWYVDPARTAARPRLPDRAQMIDNGDLADAYKAIAKALLAQVDNAEVLSLVVQATAKTHRPNIIRGRLPTDLSAAAGKLGSYLTSYSAKEFLKEIGYEIRRVAADLSEGYFSLTINGDDHDVDTTGFAADTALVKPLYQAANSLTALVANREGIPSSTVGLGLPKVALEASEPTISPKTGIIFVRDLAIVDEYGKKLAAITNPVLMEWDETHDLSLASVEVPDDFEAGVLVPLADGETPLDALHKNESIAATLLYLTETGVLNDLYESYPYFDFSADETDLAGFTLDVVEQYAKSLPDEDRAQIEREAKAQRAARSIHTALSSLLYTLGVPREGDAFVPRELEGLSESYVQELQAAGLALRELTNNTKSRLLET